MAHNLRSSILALTVKGERRPRGSYKLFTFDRIKRFVNCGEIVGDICDGCMLFGGLLLQEDSKMMLSVSVSQFIPKTLWSE